MIRKIFNSSLSVFILYAGSAIAETDEPCCLDADIAINNKNLGQAESILLRHLKFDPKNIKARFLLARVLSWQDKWSDALEYFNALLAENPDNVDFLIARANTFEWMRRRKEALQDLEKARQLSPDYIEIWHTEILILVRINDQDSINQAKALAVEANQKFPDDDWYALLIREDEIIIDRNMYAAEVSYGYDELTNNRSPWQATSVTLTMQTPDKHYAYLQLDKNKRFDLDDSQIAGSYAWPFANSWYLYGKMTYSATHRFLANNMVEAKISKSFPNKFNLHVGLSHAKYSETSSQQSYLTGEYYWSDFRTSYTYRYIDVKNAGNGYNHNIQLNKYYSSVNMIGALIAKGDDVEFDGTPSPPISNTVTYAINGQHMIQAQCSVLYSLIHHEHGNFYNSNGFVLGIKFDF